MLFVVKQNQLHIVSSELNDHVTTRYVFQINDVYASRLESEIDKSNAQPSKA